MNIFIKKRKNTMAISQIDTKIAPKVSQHCVMFVSWSFENITIGEISHPQLSQTRH